MSASKQIKQAMLEKNIKVSLCMCFGAETGKKMGWN